MKRKFYDRGSADQMLPDDSFQLLGIEAVIPNVVGIDNGQRPALAYAETLALTALNPPGTVVHLQLDQSVFEPLIEFGVSALSTFGPGTNEYVFPVRSQGGLDFFGVHLLTPRTFVGACKEPTPQ
jgi:hypothetical protein